MSERLRMLWCRMFHRRQMEWHLSLNNEWRWHYCRKCDEFRGMRRANPTIHL